MSGLFVRAGERVINLAHVAKVHRFGEQSIQIDYVMPAATDVPGVSFPFGSPPPTGVTNATEFVQGEDAVTIWERITLLARKDEQWAKSAVASLAEAAKKDAA